MPSGAGRTATRGASSSRGSCCSESPAAAPPAFMQGTDNSFSIPGTEAQAGIQQLSRSFPQASGTSAQLVDRRGRRRPGRRRAVQVGDRRHDRRARRPRRRPRGHRSVQRVRLGARLGRRERGDHPPAVRRTGDGCLARGEGRPQGGQRRPRGVAARRARRSRSAATSTRSPFPRSRSSRPSACSSPCSS